MKKCLYQQKKTYSTNGNFLYQTACNKLVTSFKQVCHKLTLIASKIDNEIDTMNTFILGHVIFNTCTNK